uniref:Uncharacterized protein n=1 Tax=Rousettus aegyptiacus TaxID=9407 RepID=A0A7J8B9B6_ROUAE|nr:hypothetical protein HJG63_009988 [Rousettus aegyptiacus]
MTGSRRNFRISGAAGPPRREAVEASGGRGSRAEAPATRTAAESCRAPASGLGAREVVPVLALQERGGGSSEDESEKKSFIVTKVEESRPRCLRIHGRCPTMGSLSARQPAGKQLPWLSRRVPSSRCLTCGQTRHCWGRPHEPFRLKQSEGFSLGEGRAF